MRFIIRVIINALVLLLIAYYWHLFGVHAQTIQAALIGGLVLGLANAIVRPILLVISCPLEVLSLGLFTLVINGLIFWLLKFVPGFVVPSFWAAFLAALVMSLISWIISIVIGEVRTERSKA